MIWQVNHILLVLWYISINNNLQKKKRKQVEGSIRVSKKVILHHCKINIYIVSLNVKTWVFAINPKEFTRTLQHI